MIAMQYKILLPDNYDMNNIRKRVANNGEKTDGFQDLLFKAYLISENDEGESDNNQYSPLYLWKDNAGMNKFIFDGFYNNILNSFGWQNINIGIPLIWTYEDDFIYSEYALAVEKEILQTTQMKWLSFSLNFENCTGKLLIYNPDKWRYSEYYFFINKPIGIQHRNLYSVLHLSR